MLTTAYERVLSRIRSHPGPNTDCAAALNYVTRLQSKIAKPFSTTRGVAVQDALTTIQGVAGIRLVSDDDIPVELTNGPDYERERQRVYQEIEEAILYFDRNGAPLPDNQIPDH
jgi:hypothetical protein